jgi:hypothetical protein
VRISPLPGWHLRLSRGTIIGSTAPLPAQGRWIAARLSRSIGSNDLEFILFEDAPGRADPTSTSIYPRGPPRPFARSDFGALPLGGSNPGKHRFARRNFAVAGRFFDLFVEVGSRGLSDRHLRSLNDLMASLRVDPGDHYPGTLESPSFTPTRGWHVVAEGRTPFGPETAANAVAATIRYRDPLAQFPPSSTLKALPTTGIIIYLHLPAARCQQPRPATQRKRCKQPDCDRKLREL